MPHPKSESPPRIGAHGARLCARIHALPGLIAALPSLIAALPSLIDALLGPPPWRAGAPVEIAIAWTQTQLMWSDPIPCARGMGDSP